MKKIVKKINILSFILGAIICGSISLVSAYTSIYYVQVLTDDTTITTTFNTDASNVAPSNVDISAIKINA